ICQTGRSWVARMNSKASGGTLKGRVRPASRGFREHRKNGSLVPAQILPGRLYVCIMHGSCTEAWGQRPALAATMMPTRCTAMAPTVDDALFDLLRPQRLTAVVDIGASPIDGEPPYKPMLDAGLCTLTGFEPQPEALAELNRRKGANETYLPYAVGDGRAHVL